MISPYCQRVIYKARIHWERVIFDPIVLKCHFGQKRVILSHMAGHVQLLRILVRLTEMSSVGGSSGGLK